MLGFIGAGAMGSAIIRGVIDSGLFTGEEIFVSEPNAAHAKKIAEDLGIQTAAGNVDLVNKVGKGGIVILAVKPHIVPLVLKEVREAAAEQGTVLVSIAAGTTLASMAENVADGQPIVRIMPNVNAMIRQSMSALCPGEFVSDEQQATVSSIFEAVGLVEIMAEKDMAIYAAIAGCSPAYTFEYIDAMARAAVKNGLPKAQAVRIAAQAVLGSAATVLARAEDGLSPANLADMVQSPGGTTVAGVVALEDAGFGRAVVRGVQASVDRDLEMQGH